MVEVQLNERQAKQFAAALTRNEIQTFIKEHQEEYNQFLLDEASKQQTAVCMEEQIC